MGSVHAPGGQLIQATDQWVGARNARLVLLDDDGVRAPVVARWLRLMSHDACVLEGGVEAADLLAPTLANRSQPVAAVSPQVPRVRAADLAEGAIHAGLPLIDLRPSMAFRKAHIGGARWSTRARLGTLGLAAGEPVVLVASEAATVALAALDLAEMSIPVAGWVGEAADAWRAGGLAVASSETPADADCIDYLFFTHDRHAGNAAAARQYLAWETGLVSQLDTSERSTFLV